MFGKDLTQYFLLKKSQGRLIYFVDLYSETYCNYSQRYSLRSLSGEKAFGGFLKSFWRIDEPQIDR